MERQFKEVDLSQVVACLIKGLRPGDVLALSGPLASGKTTLTKEIARQLGYEGRVASPTFVLERRYPLAKGAFKMIDHFDFYRLDKRDLASFDWQETLTEPDHLTIIEWPEVAAQLLPRGVKKVSLEIIDGQTRKISTADFTD